jgi:GNAT superfamily N-acetyltransferase
VSIAQRLRHRFRKYLDDWRSFPADAALGFRKEGWHGVWLALAPRSVYRVIRFERLVVFAQPVEQPEQPLPSGVTIRRLAEEDFPALGALMGERELKRCRVLVNAGNAGLIAWREGRPIGYAWVAARLGPDVTACRFPLPSYAAYLWDLYVIPAERGTGVGTALAAARLQTARDWGFREGWRTITPSNGASLATLRKSGGSGTRVVGEVRYLKVLSRMRSHFVPNGATSCERYGL